MLLNLASLTGLIACLWIIAGVALAGRFYANYSHTQQLCSELGAAGSPTEKLSPVINNYPLAILFCLFGFYVLDHSSTLLVSAIGWCVIAHGIGTLVAGYFPMDADPYTEHPSRSCNIHTIAGIVMLLSLLVAPVLVFFTAVPLSFKLFSALCLVLFLLFTGMMAQEYNKRGKIGLYQRLSYGAQLLWLAGYSLLLNQAL